jgi:flagellar L-ring protein precursor FlgH
MKMFCRSLSISLLLFFLSGCSDLVNDHEFSPAASQLNWAERTPRAVTRGSIFAAGADMRLFEDRTARRVGDVLTIVLTERTNASKSATTNITKDSDIKMTNPTVFGKSIGYQDYSLEMQAQGNRLFEGEGASDQSNSLTGRVSAVVMDVHRNGNLVVRGGKKLTLNQGDEFVEIIGIVRPDDIRADNSVLSTQVADAQITYAGTGATADANAPGWFERVMLHPLWPY